MNTKKYDKIDDIACGDIVVMDVDKHNPFSTCIVQNVGAHEIKLARPMASVSQFGGNVWVTMETFEIEIKRFLESFLVYIYSNKKDNRRNG